MLLSPKLTLKDPRRDEVVKGNQVKASLPIERTRSINPRRVEVEVLEQQQVASLLLLEIMEGNAECDVLIELIKELIC